MYVLVRKDLPLRHQVVQASHAAIQATNLFPSNHPNLVVLAVEDAGALCRAVARARTAGIPIEPFYEPDDNMGFTAAATAPLTRTQRKAFRGYPLWDN